jgi:hypothetical protein
MSGRINIRQKGAGGEREICDMLNAILYARMKKLGYAKETLLEALKAFQRNQNQTAVGGSDITNPFRLSIEVKRQEALSLNTWWKQCVTSAESEGALPVLIYRQNHKPWRVRTYGYLMRSDVKGTALRAVVEFDWETFQQWADVWLEPLIVGRYGESGA